MKIIKTIISILFSVICASGYAEVHTIDVGQFEKLKVNGNFTLIYKNLPDSTGYARYAAPADSEDLYLFIKKDDGSLKVEPVDDKWGRTDLPVVYVYSNFLSSVESYSNQNVEVLNLAPCASFNANLVGNGSLSIDNIKCNSVTAAITTGNGSIYLSGVCVNANYRMVGAGLISADQLQANVVKCRILGTGSIGCWPIDNLNVTGLGSTKIYYKGSPNIKKKGGGKLFELPDEIEQESYSRLGTPVTTFQPDEEDEEEDDEEEYDGDDDDYQTVVSDDD